jgi:hypothetical protein
MPEETREVSPTAGARSTLAVNPTQDSTWTEEQRRPGVAAAMGAVPRPRRCSWPSWSSRWADGGERSAFRVRSSGAADGAAAAFSARAVRTGPAFAAPGFRLSEGRADAVGKRGRTGGTRVRHGPRACIVAGHAGGQALCCPITKEGRADQPGIGGAVGGRIACATDALGHTRTQPIMEGRASRKIRGALVGIGALHAEAIRGAS